MLIFFIIQKFIPIHHLNFSASNSGVTTTPTSRGGATSRGNDSSGRGDHKASNTRSLHSASSSFQSGNTSGSNLMVVSPFSNSSTTVPYNNRTNIPNVQPSPVTYRNNSNVRTPSVIRPGSFLDSGRGDSSTSGPGGDKAIVCNCGNDAVQLTVRKEGPNTGKYYTSFIYFKVIWSFRDIGENHIYFKIDLM